MMFVSMLLFCEDAEHTTEEPLKEESKNLYIKFKNMAGGTHENVKGVQKWLLLGVCYKCGQVYIGWNNGYEGS